MKSRSTPSTAGPALVEDYKTAMRHVVSPVAVVTWRHAERWEGMTVTAICSATTEPPTLVVCIRADKPAADGIREAGRFAVNFLSDEQADIARRFSSHPQTGPETGADAFDPAHWRRGENGAPVLEKAVSRFDCTVEHAFAQGSHVVFLGRVTALGTAPGASLLYRDGFFRRLSPE